jgi:cutinase
MSQLSLRARAAAALSVAAAAAAVGGTTLAAPSAAAVCTDIHVVFARGSGELPGLGITGGPFVDAVRSNAAGRSVSSYAVNYAAALDQSSAGAGATDMTRHVVQYAAECPGARIVLGGYSQGASVTDISIGIPTVLGRGETIPASLSSRVTAVVVFGNPLRLTGGTIPTSSRTYGPKALDDCNAGDPVCAGGINVLAHLTYGFDGSAAAGGRFAAQRSR